MNGGGRPTRAVALVQLHSLKKHPSRRHVRRTGGGPYVLGCSAIVKDTAEAGLLEHQMPYIVDEALYEALVAAMGSRNAEKLALIQGMMVPGRSKPKTAGIW